MKNKKYWEDVEYKDAIKEYSEWNQRCLTLNEFNPMIVGHLLRGMNV